MKKIIFLFLICTISLAGCVGEIEEPTTTTTVQTTTTLETTTTLPTTTTVPTTTTTIPPSNYSVDISEGVGVGTEL